MLNKYARALFAAIFTPVATLLVRLKVSPDAVTIIGTLGVAGGALIGAGAIVAADVPEGATVRGEPARDRTRDI